MIVAMSFAVDVMRVDVAEVGAHRQHHDRPDPEDRSQGEPVPRVAEDAPGGELASSGAAGPPTRLTASPP